MSVLNSESSDSFNSKSMGDVLGKESENASEMPLDSFINLIDENPRSYENTPKKTMSNIEESVILNKFSQLNLNNMHSIKQENVNGSSEIADNENGPNDMADNANGPNDIADNEHGPNDSTQIVNGPNDIVKNMNSPNNTTEIMNGPNDVAENVNGSNDSVKNVNVPNNLAENEAIIENECICRLCNQSEFSPTEDLEEIKQLNFIEICHYVRTIYRSTSSKYTVNEKYQTHIKNFVSMLCNLDPHELFHRLEAQIEAFITDTKITLLELLKNDRRAPDLPRKFISELLDGYKKLMIGVSRLQPVLSELETTHLSKFQTTWKVINQSMYYSCVYSDPAIQNNMPIFISLLSNAPSDTAEVDKKLIRLFLSFDDEISSALQAWAETEASIKAYNSSLKSKQEMLNSEWQLFKSKLAEVVSDGKLNDAKAVNEIANSFQSFCLVTREDKDTDIVVNENSDYSSISEEDSETNSNAGDKYSSDENEKEKKLDRSSEKNESNTSEESKKSGNGSLAKVTPPSNVSSNLESNPTLDRRTHVPVSSSVSVPEPAVAASGGKAVTPVSGTQPRPPTVVSTVSKPQPQGHLCHKHVGRTVEDEESCPVHASCNKRDSRQCGCCYCEVFGHAMTSVAPVSRNYQEIRDRLRFLLNKKKKCKTAPTNNKPKQPVKETVKAASNKSKTQGDVKDPRNLNDLLNFIEGEVRLSKTAAKKAARKELLQQKKQEEIDRRKREEEEAERKRIEEEKRKEEEEKVRKRNQELEEHRRAKKLEKKKRYKEKIRLRQAEEAAAIAIAALERLKGNQSKREKERNNPPSNVKANNQNNKNNKNTTVNNVNNKNSNNSNNSNKSNKTNSKDNKNSIPANSNKNKNSANSNINNNSANNTSKNNKNKNKVQSSNLNKLNVLDDLNDSSKKEPQIVTIKRVMESNSAEPTVTITLRGATHSEDKVLYTLFNGQVRPVKNDNSNNNSNSNNSKKKKNKNKSENNVKQVKSTPNNNPSNKKDSVSNVNKSINSSNKKNEVTLTKTSHSDLKVKLQQCNNNVVLQQCNNNATLQQCNNNAMLQQCNNNAVLQQCNNNAMLQQCNNNTILQQCNNNAMLQQCNSNAMMHHYNNTAMPQHNPMQGFFNSVTVTRNSQPSQPLPFTSNPTSTFNPPTLPLPFKRSSLVLPEAKLTSPTAIQINNAINKLAQPHNGSFNLENLKLPPGITITKVNPATIEERRPMQRQQQQQQQQLQQQQQQQQYHQQQQDHYNHQQHMYNSQPSSSNVIVVDTGKLQVSKQYMDRAEVVNGDASGNSKKKRRKKKNSENSVNLSMNPPLNVNKLAPKDMSKNPQAAIIKVNGSMVTIRSPALQQALDAQNPSNSCEQSKKKRSKKKKNSQNPKEEWNLDNIFAPKDIDLENGDIDDDEKELEAFKRFCLQSVPPERKKKVHLNIKDIVMKKKAPAISCN